MVRPDVRECDLGALANSLIIAVSASVFATRLGVLAARASTRFEFSGKGAITELIMLRLSCRDHRLDLASGGAFVAVGVTLNIFTVIGHTLICMPLRR